MNERDWLAERFEENRPHLRAVAYRMLGSASEADDAVQETWLRLSRSGTAGVENLGGWLTTIGAISSNGTANMSCSTNASRSTGVSVSSTTSNAGPTESASTAWRSGST